MTAIYIVVLNRSYIFLILFNSHLPNKLISFNFIKELISFHQKLYFLIPVPGQVQI